MPLSMPFNYYRANSEQVKIMAAISNVIDGTRCGYSSRTARKPSLFWRNTFRWLSSP